ncbi:MAG: hypothetical protein HYZ11_03715 [Candidatus Tectomicrobia bacterium]|uniref:Uncharacterized protein n=1 Tax=Tectimicrobiota bacterium TaxID=2528274 RepID=A0A932HZU4_UNCTE|nr:hypothetical protein [Candidatus Tectomicrobia bacterium]
MRRLPFFRSIFLVLLPLLVLAGCFFPTDFDLRIAIQRNGDFEEFFSGVLVEWNPYERWKKGEFPAEEADRRSKETLRAVLKQPEGKAEDFSIREESPFRYRVTYRRRGNLHAEFKKTRTPFSEGKPDVMSFLVDMLYLRRGADGALLLERRKVPPEDQERFRHLGLEMKGALSLRVQGKVVEHDAQAVSGGEHRWTVESLARPSVRMVFRLD